MRIMSLDVGDKRIGIALSDPLKITAQGLETLTRSTDQKDLSYLWDLVKEYEVSELVVGLPKNMNGSLGPQGEKVQDFVEKFRSWQDNQHLKIIFVDERLTTVVAERTLIAGDVSRKNRKKVVDKLAAILILQTYLDAQ